jgi:S-adenosylmethionine decarboxylase
VLFEGPEKKLELLTGPHGGSLRALGFPFWKQVVAWAEAEILSCTSNDACDAYLLSESSLFVFERRVVMITCGKTKLINALLGLLDRLPSGDLISLIYERKNENFPQLQQTTFQEDVSLLNKRVSGQTVLFGNRRGDHISLYHLNQGFEPDPDDTTLELLMYDIDPKIGRLFSPQAKTSLDLIRKFDLDNLFPGFQFDDHRFEPMGYSFNAILGEYYGTLHVTPQRKGSYVSFETNFQTGTDDARARVCWILDHFRPARSDLLLFQGKLDLSGLQSGFSVEKTEERTLSCGYQVTYAHIERETCEKS